jgi:16S rRNA (uracil1498-N3)-methyltransferase
MLLRSRRRLNNPTISAATRRNAALACKTASIGPETARQSLHCLMPRIDFRTPRLFVDRPLEASAALDLDRNQANYLTNVLRLGSGDRVLVFNSREGEWAATISSGKRPVLVLAEQIRPQGLAADILYAFAPLKHARLDYIAQKAIEMGASSLLPVITQRTQVSRVNLERMRANVIEAAEQCGILNIAAVAEPMPLTGFLANRDANRVLIFCDEDADEADPIAALKSAKIRKGIDVLIGPEGGFAVPERRALLEQPNVVRLSLGPRILRADTAGVAALALIEAAFGPSLRSDEAK